MKKFNLLTLMLAGAMSTATLTSQAQKMLSFETNWYADYVGNIVAVTAPASIGGALNYTIANDGGGGTGEWGGAITTTITQEVVKADPYEGCVNFTNASAINGKIALIKRGNCEFGEKALRAQQAGAVAVIIVNNVTGGPVGMGAGSQGSSVNIPVIMISDVDGAKIDNALNSGTVEVTLSQWSTGVDHDIAIVRTGVSQFHAQSIPLAQLSAGTPGAYEGITGAVIANFGSKPTTNVKLKSTVSFTPTGGSASVIHKDSVVTPGTFAPADSIMTPFVDMAYALNTITSTGRVDITYEVTSDSTDELPGDNTTTFSFYITDNILSKGRYDFANDRSISNIAYAFATSQDFMWGPTYFIAKGGYTVNQAQFALSQTGGGSMAGAGTVPVVVWKWVDGSNGQTLDGIIVSGECTPVGVGGHTYGTGDTSGQVFTVDIKDYNDGVSDVVLDDNSWYWVTVGVPVNTFLACDGTINYYVRTWARFNQTNNPDIEPFSPMYAGTDGAFVSGPTEVPNLFPFEPRLQVDSIRFSQQTKGTVPSVPLILSAHPVSVKNIGQKFFNVELFPNPATEVLNVSVKLEEQSKQVHYTIIDAMGRMISQDVHNNVKQDKYTVNTTNIAAGNYFLVITADNKTIMKKFSVVK